MKTKFLLFACCLFNLMLFSQSKQQAFVDWSDTTGTQNFFYKTITAVGPKGDIYVAGATINSSGNPDILVAKYSNIGAKLWVKQYSGLANSIDFAAGLFIDRNEDVYITGTVSNNTSTLETDLIVIKYSKAGVQQWVSTYDGSGNLDGGKSIVVDGSGNVYVTGGSYNSSFNSDIVTVAFDNSGSQLWANIYDFSSSLDDIGYNICFNKSTQLLVTGAVTSWANNFQLKLLYIDINTGNIDDDATGSTVTTSSVDVVNDMTIDTKKNIYITGGYNVIGQGMNYYTMKLDSNLTEQWTQTINNSNLDDIAKSIAVDSLENVYVTGFVTTTNHGKNIYTVQYDATGNQQWEASYDGTLHGDDEPFDMVIDTAKNIYITGSVMSNINQIDYNTFKYDVNGIKLWEIQSDAHHLNDKSTNIVLDSANNVIITGQCETAPNVFEYRTEKYVQKDVITPTDFNGETPQNNALYYENKGQLISTTNTAVPDVKFYTNNTYPAHYIKSNSSSFVFAKIDTVASTNDTLNRIDMTYDGANNTKTYPMETQKDGYLNYYLAHTGSYGISTVFGNQRLITPEIYPNIDLMYSSNQNGIKYYYIIKPGGNPKDIGITFTGASSFTLNGTTNALSINSSMGSLTFDKPTAYQLSATNATIAVTGWTSDWQTNGASNKYRFNTGTYTTSLTLVIEVDQGNSVTASAANKNLTWCTYYGGASEDQFLDVKSVNTDVWVTGFSKSINFPTYHSYQGTNAGNFDAIFVKFNTLGVRQWATYIGGTLDETDYHINGIEVDKFGNSYSAFKTASSDFPTKQSFLAGEYYDNINSGASIAIVEFNNSGQLLYSTYFGGGSANATTYDIALDNNTNLIVTGTGGGIPITTPSGSYVNSHTITNGCYIAKFGLNHNIVWSSYLGDLYQYAEKLAVNTNNEIIVVGQLYSTSVSSFDFVHPLGSYFDNTFNGGPYDGFIMKFDGIGNTLNWSTLYGGAGFDRIHAVTTDNTNNIYISGDSESSSNFITGNAFGYSDTTYNGSGSFPGSVVLDDAFLAKFSSANQFISSTYFGGSANEGAFDLAYLNNSLFIPFTTASNDMPFYGSNPSTVFVQANNKDGQDASYDGYFLATDKDFKLKWSSYFGGTNANPSPYSKQDLLYSNIPSSDNKYYIVGATASDTLFPIVSLAGAYNQPNITSIDGFIAQFDISNLPLPQSVHEINNANDNLFVYPNPANQIVYISYPVKDKYSIEIIDITGRLIYITENQTNANIKIDVSDFAKGAYIIKVIDKENTAVKKLIIN